MPRYGGINTVDMLAISKMIRDTPIKDASRKALARALCDYFSTRQPLVPTDRFYTIMTRFQEDD